MTFEQALAQSKTTGNWESDFALGWQARDEEVKALDSTISALEYKVYKLQARIERVLKLQDRGAGGGNV